MGLDIGTTGCKANVFDQNGNVLCARIQEYLHLEHGGTGIDAEGVWDEVCSAVGECTADFPEIEAICTTSFGESAVPVDEQGNALSGAILYTNANAVKEWGIPGPEGWKCQDRCGYRSYFSSYVYGQPAAVDEKESGGAVQKDS